jgi:uncharacterized Zn finger protein
MTGGTTLQAALDREGLRRMAGARSFGRGEKYFAVGRVHSLIDQEGTVTGKVHGRREYRIKLWGNPGGLHHSCTCQQLANRRQNTRPEDALPIYQSRIEPTLEEKNAEAHRACVDLLRKIRTLIARLGTEPEFALYLEEVCRSHRRKWNFIKLLDQASWK